MALNSLGQISMGGSTAGESIALELGLGTTTTISLGDSVVKTLGGFISSSNVDMGSFRGKSTVKELSSGTGVNVQNLNIYNVAVAAGWDKVSKVTYTITSGSYIWTDSTSLAALDTGGAFPNGLTIYNGGYIMGKGGDGSPMIGATVYTAGAAGAGGPAINVTANCTIVNNGYIGGGGGGGGSGGAHIYNSNMRIYYDYYATGGGGAGGGNGGCINGTGFYLGGTITPPFYGKGSELCTGGAIGQSGGKAGFYAIGGGYGPYPYRLGGGGGRIMPGVGGTGAPAGTTTNSNGGGGGAGGGGAASVLSGTNAPFNRGGNGGAGGAAGETPGATQSALGGGGGGWGASGGSGTGGGGGTSTGGAAGGKAIAKNGFTVTTSGAGTTYGAVG